MPYIEGTHEVVADAPLQRCVEVLLDAERYPEWFDTLDGLEVTSRKDGFVDGVRLLVRTPLGDLRPELSQVWSQGRLERRQTNRSLVRDFYDRWELEPVDAGRTRVVHSISLDHDLGFLRSKLLDVRKGFLRDELLVRFAESFVRRAERIDGEPER